LHVDLLAIFIVSNTKYLCSHRLGSFCGFGFSISLLYGLKAIKGACN
ncbi:hypothetical protein RJ639_044607, partial [Escallonia herrerae]